MALQSTIVLKTKKIGIRHVVLIVLIVYTALNILMMSKLHSEEEENNKNKKEKLGSGSLFSSLGGGGELGVLNHNKNHPDNRLAWALLEKNKIRLKQQEQQQKVVNEQKTTKTTTNSEQALSCSAYGGPSEEDAAEMIYWNQDDDATRQEFESIYTTPNDNDEDEKYLVFEPDEAGFSNVRLSLETVVALAMAMGRTLVLPPKTRFAQLYDGYPRPNKLPKSYDYTDFFHIGNSIPTISLQTYLEKQNGKLRDHNGTGNIVSLPNGGRTNYDGRVGNSQGSVKGDNVKLWKFVAQTMTSIDWKRDLCIVAFPAHKANNGTAITQAMNWVLNDDKTHSRLPSSRMAEYTDHPTPVNASTVRRMREIMAARKELCHYTATLQNETSLFMTGQEATGSRPLVPFYAYLFFEDWRHDVLMKRFVRDHLRFANVIQCAAARIVHAIRDRIRQQQQQSAGSNSATTTTSDTSFDTMHVRRKDFMTLDVYKNGIIPAQDMRDFFQPNRTVYIATDEANRTFFEPLRQKSSNIFFLSDFSDLLQNVDPNMYGMVEQLVCARGRLFVGTFYSTFSAYINRIRGYHALKQKLPGHKRGIINSEYMGHNNAHRLVMEKYMSVQGQLWIREWPVGWRDIDHEITTATNTTIQIIR